MNKFGSSRPVSRSEDVRLLTGQGTFVDSIAPDGSLYACFLRSPVAHARITGLNLYDARKAEGVRLVLGAKDLIAAEIMEGLPFEVVETRDGS